MRGTLGTAHGDTERTSIGCVVVPFGPIPAREITLRTLSAWKAKQVRHSASKPRCPSKLVIHHS
jgi:hypothetical protein